MRDTVNFVGKHLFALTLIVAVLISTILVVRRNNIDTEKLPNAPLQEERVNNITKIFMHEPGEYTVHIMNPETKIEEPTYLPARYPHPRKVEFAYDAPEESLEWLVVSYREYYEDRRIEGFRFHRHPGSEILGAGWDHGKGGRGRTNVIE